MFVVMGGLTWRRREGMSAERWIGRDGQGQEVGSVGDMVTHERRGPVRSFHAYWHDRSRAPGPVDLGDSFDSAESAMAAVDESWDGSC
jgi:hypothetical protein